MHLLHDGIHNLSRCLTSGDRFICGLEQVGKVLVPSLLQVPGQVLLKLPHLAGVSFSVCLQFRFPLTLLAVTSLFSLGKMSKDF